MGGQIQVGQVGDDPSLPGVVGGRGLDEPGIGIDASDAMTARGELAAYPALAAAGVRPARPEAA